MCPREANGDCWTERSAEVQYDTSVDPSGAPPAEFATPVTASVFPSPFEPGTCIHILGSLDEYQPVNFPGLCRCHDSALTISRFLAGDALNAVTGPFWCNVLQILQESMFQNLTSPKEWPKGND